MIKKLECIILSLLYGTVEFVKYNNMSLQDCDKIACIFFF